jgi:hypothetical protein
MVNRHKGETVSQMYSFLPVIRSIGQMRTETVVVTDLPELRPNFIQERTNADRFA